MYYAFTKRVDDGYTGTEDPTVNHMIIVEDLENAVHTYDPDTDYETDVLSNLDSADRIYYLLYATRGTGTPFINNQLAQDIFIAYVERVLCAYKVPDNCDSALVFSFERILNCNWVGTNQFLVSAIDQAGNKDSCYTDITLIDTIDPVITCREDSTYILNYCFDSLLINYGFLLNSSDTEWVDTIIDFSTEYSPGSWSANQVIGPPDVFPAYGDIEEAWAAETTGDQREFFELKFKTAVHAEEVLIYETYNPGAVDTAYLRDASTDTWHMIWSGTAMAPYDVDSSRIFRITFDRTVYRTDAVRLAINTPAVSSWNEIDAVALLSSEKEFADALATDNCVKPLNAIQTSGQTSGSYFEPGEYVNEFIALDSSGNMDSCSFTITVIQSDSTCACDTLYLNDNPIDPGIYRSIFPIFSNGIVGAGSSVEFYSEAAINLGKGFGVSPTAEFKADVVPCPVEIPPPIPGIRSKDVEIKKDD